jgi:tetratricopeptide (TPR) repeat protein
MSDNEKEPRQIVANTTGAERAKSYISLSLIAFERNDHEESLAMCETARDLFEAEGSKNCLYQIGRGRSGIAINLQKLGRYREAAQSAGEAVELLRELQSEALGELLRDQGRYGFSAGEYQSSRDCHMEAMEIPDPDIRDISIAVGLLNIGMAEGKLLCHGPAVDHLLGAREIFRKGKEVTWVAVCDELLLSHSEAIEVRVRGNREPARYLKKSRTQIWEERVEDPC